MRALTGTFQIPRGDDVNLKFVFTDRNGERYTPTGVAEIRFSAESCKTKITTVDCWVEGHSVFVHLTPEDTAMVGEYRADLQFTFSDSETLAPGGAESLWTPWIGHIEIIGDVSL